MMKMIHNEESHKDDDKVRVKLLKKSLFPEVENAQINRETISCLNKLAKPTQKLRFIVSNFIDYLIDTDGAVESIENIINLLKSSKSDDNLRALEFIHNLCKKQASRLGLASSIDLINCLKFYVDEVRDYNKMSHALSSLQHISKGKQGALNMISVGLIPIILKLLKSEDKKTVERSVSILDNVLHHDDKCRELVRSCRGIELLIELIDSGGGGVGVTDVKLLTVVIDALHKLCYRHIESKIIMLTNGGTEKVVQLMRQYTYEKLLFTCSKLMKVLSVCNSNKPVLVDAGALEILGVHLQSKTSPRLVQSCLWSIRNLSDHAAHLPGMSATIELLVTILSSENINDAICAVGCLCNFTAGNSNNKVAFIQAGGVQSICQLMCEHINRQEIVEPGTASLRHATYDNPLASQAIGAVFDSPLLSNLAVLIRGRPDKMLPLIKALVGLIRNLSFSSSSCRKSLIDLGVVESLCEIFQRTLAGMNDLAKQRNSIVSISSELSYVEGVRLEDLLELSLCALQAICKDSQAKKIVSYQNKLVQSVVQLVMIREYSPPLHRASLSLLAEIAESGDNSKLMQSEGFNSRLSELLNSSNRAIAIYAAVVIFFISQDKPSTHLDRIQQELMQSLQRQQQQDQDRFHAPSIASSVPSSNNQYQIDLPNVPLHEPTSNGRSRTAYDNAGYVDSPHSREGRRTNRTKQQPFHDIDV